MEGLQRLHDVIPAGETYMHEGLKEVRIKYFFWCISNNRTLCASLCNVLSVGVNPIGLGPDPDADCEVLEHHPGADGREAGSLRSPAHSESGEGPVVRGGLREQNRMSVPLKTCRFIFTSLI